MLLIGKTWKPAPTPRQVHDAVSLIPDQGCPQCNQNVRFVSLVAKEFCGSRNRAKGIDAVILLTANLWGGSASRLLLISPGE